MPALVVFKAPPGSYYSNSDRTSDQAESAEMLAPLTMPPEPGPKARPASRGVAAFFDAIALRWPFAFVFLLVFFSNGLGSFFNISYNARLIVANFMDADQQDVFWNIAFPWYNVVAYAMGISLTIYLLYPLARARSAMMAGKEIPLKELEQSRRRLVNLPFCQVCINFLGWLPGAVIFPLLVCGLGGANNIGPIWGQFLLSFLVSALLTTAQTFFLLETYLIRYFYPDFFRDTRPADLIGVIRVPFGTRLLLLWSALAVPLLALLMVAVNFDESRNDHGELRQLAFQVAIVGGGYGALVFWLVGRDVQGWVVAHAAATEQIEQGNYDVHVYLQRPDEWGQLTDRFNDMAAALGRARQLRETFGQFVSPEVRDDILQNYPGLEGQEQEVTVLFTDIRGFTHRTAGESPKKVVALLNRFLTLAVGAIEEQGGLVNKFLGDGIMALFGVRRLNAMHADQAVNAANELLERLRKLNAELESEGEEPLRVGIGIHTGPALIGCIGAKITLDDGRERVRREFTAIGATVNMAQRLEQLTKNCAGPILVSEQTRNKLRTSQMLRSHGPLTVPGFDNSLVVYEVRQP